MILCKSYLIKKPKFFPNNNVSIRGIAAFVYRNNFYDYYISDVLYIEENAYDPDYCNYLLSGNPSSLTKELVKKYFIKQEDI